MPQTRLRLPLLAVLAALLLSAQPTPAHADEPLPPDETAEAETITAVLQPGWNMVGWIGPETPVADLFDALPALERVSAWDAEAQQYQRATRASSEEFPALTPGRGLWLRVGGDVPVHWTRPVIPEGVVLRLQPGLNLVGIAADGPIGQFDPAASGAWTWERARERYETYSFGGAALAQGDAIWLQVAVPVNWWQPGTAEPPIVFLGDIPEHVQAEIRAAYDNARAFFAERFAVVATHRLTYVGEDPDAVRDIYREHFGFGQYEPNEGFCGTGSSLILLKVLRCAYPPERLQFWNDHTAGIVCCDHLNPQWMHQGTWGYVATLYAAASGFEEYDAARANLIARARQGPRPLRDLDTWDDTVLRWMNRGVTIDDSLRGAYAGLGFLALEWLASHAGDLAIPEYYRLLPRSLRWEDAFEAAFGITVSDFYDVFEAYAETVAPPLPHLTDLRREPAMVFLGDVPASTELAISAEFEQVRAFFAERFKARAAEFTVYVAPDAETASAVFPGWDESGGNCTRPIEGVIVLTFDRCGDPPPQDSYYIEALMGADRLQRVPWWLASGTRAYAMAAYRAAEKGLDLEQYRATQIDMATRSALPLRDTSTGSGALAYLAVEWLVNHAGEDALFGYYFTLARVFIDIDLLFSLSFDVTIDDFYKHFEAYRAELSQP